MFFILYDEQLLNDNKYKMYILIIDSNMRKFIKWEFVNYIISIRDNLYYL